MRDALPLLVCVLVAFNQSGARANLPGPLPEAQAGASQEEMAVRQTVEEFLRRLGNRDVDSLLADFTPKAVIIVAWQREAGFVNSIQTVDEFIAALRQAVAARAPTAKRRESPGKKGMMTRPVSQKIIKNSITYNQGPKLPAQTFKYWSR